jgi:hypothetical protein
MELRVKIEDLKKIDLTLTQYVYLWGLYNNVRIKYLDIQQEGIDILNEKHYIAKLKDKEEYVLTEHGVELFEPKGGIFEEFLQTFPTRVNDQTGRSRVLSPVDAKSLSGEKMKKKWYSITKNKIELEEHILSCLKQEVVLRKKEGSLFYMRNIETWLNKATWEDYQYLLEKQKPEDRGFAKVNEIRL